MCMRECWLLSMHTMQVQHSRMLEEGIRSPEMRVIKSYEQPRGAEPGSSGKTACAHNHWDISPASIVIFQCIPTACSGQTGVFSSPLCCFWTSGFSILDLYNDISCDRWLQPSPMLENITNLLLCAGAPLLTPLYPTFLTLTFSSPWRWVFYLLDGFLQLPSTAEHSAAWFTEKVCWLLHHLGDRRGLCMLGKRLTKWSTFSAFIGKFW